MLLRLPLVRRVLQDLLDQELLRVLDFRQVRDYQVFQGFQAFHWVLGHR